MIPPRALVWCVAVTLAAPPVFVAASPQQERPPVFRGGTTFVSVDAYPRKNGAFVDGLAAADFTILEDGKPQAVSTFELVRFEPNPDDSERVDPNSVADSERQAADPHARLFVVYLDVYHTTFNGSRMGSQPVVDFLERTITKADLFAVLTPNTPIGGLTFARRTETIRRALTDKWDWGERRGGQEFLTEPGEQDIAMCAARLLDPRKPLDDQQGGGPIRRYREDLLMTSLERLTVRLGDLRDERKNVLFLSEGWVPAGPVTVNALYQPKGPPTIGVGRGGTLGRDPTPNVLTSANHVSSDDECRAKLQRLFDMDFAERFDRLVTAAARANITFYPVDVGGLKVGGVGNQSTLRTLAEANDGVAVVNSNDIGGAFRRLSDRVSAYYLLGYYSNNDTRDGRFRKIEVKVNGETVSARRGYFAYPVPVAPPVTAPVTPAPMLEALNLLGRLDSGDEVYGSAAATSDAVDVVVDLAAREIDRGRWAKGADVQILLRNDRGDELVRQTRIEEGKRAVRVSVETGGKSGPWRASVSVDSDGRRAEVAFPSTTADRSSLGLPVLFRGASSARVALQPAAEARFTRNERLHLEVPVDSADRERTARVLDRRGQPLPVAPGTSVQTTADGRTLVVVDVMASAMAPGDYLLEVSAGGPAEVGRRYVAFRVVR